MQWKTKIKPIIGDVRWVKRFALLPTNLDDGYSVWLEYYYVKQVYWSIGKWVKSCTARKILIIL